MDRPAPLRFAWRRPIVFVAVVAAVVGGGAAVVRMASVNRAERAVSNAHRLLAVERWMGIDVERQAQQTIAAGSTLDIVLTSVYAFAYWPFVGGAVVMTLLLDRPAFRLLRNGLLISGAAGLTMMFLFPVAPPRLLGRPYDDRVARIEGLRRVAHPDGWFNELAAMPSFHICWMIVAATAMRRCAPPPARWALPVVMAVAVLTTGNHYVADVLAGAVLAAAAWRAAASMQRRVERRSERSDRAEPEPDHHPSPALRSALLARLHHPGVGGEAGRTQAGRAGRRRFPSWGYSDPD